MTKIEEIINRHKRQIHHYSEQKFDDQCVMDMMKEYAELYAEKLRQAIYDEPNHVSDGGYGWYSELTIKDTPLPNHD